MIETMVGFLLLVLAACAPFGNGITTAPVLNISAPVPSDSRLYFLHSTEDSSGIHYTIVGADAVTGKPQWQRPILGHTPKIAVSDGIIYVVNGLDVVALRGSDGISI